MRLLLLLLLLLLLPRALLWVCLLLVLQWLGHHW
jgi:hypothetical protein